MIKNLFKTKKKVVSIALIVGLVFFAGGITVGAISNYIQSEVERIVLNMQSDMHNYTETYRGQIGEDLDSRRDEVSRILEEKAHDEAYLIRKGIDEYYRKQISIIMSDSELEGAKKQIEERARQILEDEKQHIDLMIDNYLNGDGAKG